MGRPPLHGDIDKTLEDPSLVLACERPITVMSRFITREEIAKEKLEATLPNKGVPFDIEEDISGGRFRKPGEPQTRLNRQHFKLRCCRGGRLDLQARLLANPGVGSNMAPVGSP